MKEIRKIIPFAIALRTKYLGVSLTIEVKEFYKKITKY
jgi:hypothetical protein